VTLDDHSKVSRSIDYWSASEARNHTWYCDATSTRESAERREEEVSHRWNVKISCKDSLRVVACRITARTYEQLKAKRLIVKYEGLSQQTVFVIVGGILRLYHTVHW